MRFLIDAQLPPALAHWVAGQGHEADHIAELGLLAAKDRTIWQRASSTGAVVVTKDEDFPRRRAMTAEGPQIVWLRIGNTRRGPLLRWFEDVFPQILVEISLEPTP